MFSDVPQMIDVFRCSQLFSDVLRMLSIDHKYSDNLRCSQMFKDVFRYHKYSWIISRCSLDVLRMFFRCSQDVLQMFSGCSLEVIRGKEKAVCCALGHCSLLPKSDPNAVYLPPNAVYCLQDSFQRSSLLPLLSFAARPHFKPEKNNTSIVF